MAAEPVPDPQPPRAAAGPRPQPVLDWQADALAARLTPLWPGIGVEVLASAVSTNSVLLARGRLACPADGTSPAPGGPCLPCLLVAEQQTGGRGRLGRAWQSARGDSLTFSLALPFAPADWSGLSLAVGVAIAEALDGGSAADRPRIRLKWPNDLWLVPTIDRPAAGGMPREDAAVGRKLGGILIETASTGSGAGNQRLAVIGVGLNVRPFATPVALPAGSTASLAELGTWVGAPSVLACVLPPLLRALRQFERDGFAAFAGRFAVRDALVGRRVMAGAETGVADGVGSDGALRLRTPRGVRTVVGGEVSIRLLPAAADAT